MENMNINKLYNDYTILDSKIGTMEKEIKDLEILVQKQQKEIIESYGENYQEIYNNLLLELEQIEKEIKAMDF